MAATNGSCKLFALDAADAADFELLLNDDVDDVVAGDGSKEGKFALFFKLVCVWVKEATVGCCGVLLAELCEFCSIPGRGGNAAASKSNCGGCCGGAAL